MPTVFDPLTHRASRQSRMWNVMMRPTFKQVTRMLPATAWEVRLTRSAIERASTWNRPDHVPHTPVVQQTDAGLVRGEWVGPAAVPSDKVLLYSHGSAYAVCSLRTHRRFIASFARRTGRRAFSVDYRLGPEHRFPAAHDDVVAAYLWLLERGHHADDILVAGDSAGGHLSLSLCGELRRLGLAMPSGLVLFSPLVDGSFRTAAAEYRKAGDHMVVPAFAQRLIRHYFRTARPGDPRFDVSLEAGADLPPTLVISGGGEMMRGDALLWERVQTAAGGHCEVQIWPHQAHVFPLFGLVPESRLAMAEVYRFVRELDAPVEPG